jgi:hypothetical protein
MAKKLKKAEFVIYRGYFHLPNALTEHPDFIALSGSAVKLLIEIGRQFNGGNNGDLCASISILAKRGWTSNNKLSRAKKELIERGWIIKTKKGGLGLGPDLFAITWQPIHECGGKLDAKPTTEPVRSLRDVTMKEILNKNAKPNNGTTNTK